MKRILVAAERWLYHRHDIIYDAVFTVVSALFIGIAWVIVILFFTALYKLMLPLW